MLECTTHTSTHSHGGAISSGRPQVEGFVPAESPRDVFHGPRHFLGKCRGIVLSAIAANLPNLNKSSVLQLEYTETIGKVS